MIYFRIAVASIDVLLAAAMLYVLFLATRQGGAAPGAAAPGGVALGKSRALAGNVLIAIAGGVLIFSGSLKLAHVPQVVEEMTSLSLAGWKLNLVGALELASGALFLLRPLRSVGLLVASAYLGAAICAHVQADQYYAVLPAMVVLGSCWLGAALRHPQILWSLGELGPSGAAGPQRGGMLQAPAGGR
jgi:hypothetical protein